MNIFFNYKGIKYNFKINIDIVSPAPKLCNRPKKNRVRDATAAHIIYNTIYYIMRHSLLAAQNDPWRSACR